MTATATLAGPTVYERIATGLLATDPAARALYWGAVTAEDGRTFEEIEMRPQHWLATTVLRHEAVLGPVVKRDRAIGLAHDWLCGVADGPLIPLGAQGGKWMYLIDAAGLDRLYEARGRLNTGLGQRVYLDTGVVTFLPWRSLGLLLADADEARHLALKHRDCGAMKIHVSAAELAELGLALSGSGRHAADTQPIYQPLVAA